MRVILFTGKGGVGKTSVAAATALRAAEAGYKTLVISTDAAHSLGDSFDMDLGGQPQPIAPNLWGQETDISQSISTHWGTIQSWLITLLRWRGVEETVASEIAILPGMEELGNLLYILTYYERGEYDTLMVDCAPTGETLRLLSFPEVLRWWMQKVLPWERRAAVVVRPIAKRLLNVPFPEDKVFEATQQLVLNLEKLSSILTDPEKVSIRLVLNPEKMVIKEAQRTFTYLNLYGYTTDLVVCNRLIPEEVTDSYFQPWKVQQGKYMKMIEEGFSPLPIRSIPLFPQEVVGQEMLLRMAHTLYGEEDPTQLYFRGQAQRVEKRDGGYLLSLLLPFTFREKIHLLQDGDELIVQVGSYRRNLILPRVLTGLEVQEARFEENKLLIQFGGKKDGTDTGSKPKS